MVTRGAKMLQMIQNESGTQDSLAPFQDSPIMMPVVLHTGGHAFIERPAEAQMSLPSDNVLIPHNSKGSCSPPNKFDIHEMEDPYYSGDNSDVDPNWIPTTPSNLEKGTLYETNQHDVEEINESNMLFCNEPDIRNENQDENNPIVMKYPMTAHSRLLRKGRMECRNSGKSYTTAIGKIVPERAMKDMKLCRMKCRDKVSHDNRVTLFKEYWEMNSHDRRVSYIAGLVTVQPKSCAKIKVCSPSKQKNRVSSYRYAVEVDGHRIEVCKQCFLTVFDETEGFIRICLKNKLKCTSGITAADNRGRHEPKNKTAQSKIEEIREHILSFPAYKSHYSRRHTNKKYLASNLNLTIMYELYCKKVESQCSFPIYSREFKKLNLKFKKPKIDTCNKCDVLMMRAKIEKNELEKINILQELKEHTDSADLAYMKKSEDKEAAKTDATKKVYTFDLQQCLPTPHLNTSVSFYKRQLWTFNLTIHDNVTGQPYCYMWHEGLAGRGANQIASCLFHFMKQKLPIEAKHVTFYSDTCGGQNKNNHVAAMFQVLISEHPTLEVIDHKFLVAGHTHMECDIDHAAIEKMKKNSGMIISVPYDWYQLVRATGKKHKFEVIVMKQEDFFDFAHLLKSHLQVRKKNNRGEDFTWQSIRWLQYTKQFGNVLYKTTLNEEDPFATINYGRKGRSTKNIQLNKCYDGPQPINKEKKKDLLSMLPLVDPIFHRFYQELITNEQLKDCDPDLDEFLSDSE